MNSSILEENAKLVESAKRSNLSALAKELPEGANIVTAMHPATPTRDIPERYLQAVALSFKNGADMWHLMTTMPQNFDQKCIQLGASIAAFANNYKHSRPLPQNYVTLADDIYASIFSHSNGIYYLVTRNYLDDADVFAPHMAQTIIKEAIDKVAIRNADHQSKAKEMCSMLEKLVRRIDDLIKLIPKANVSLRNTLDDFAEYLELQEECLQAALSYDGSNVELLEQKPIKISKELKQWHAEPALALTPTKPGSSHKRTLEQYQQYQVVRSEKTHKKIHTEDAADLPDAEETEDCGYIFQSEPSTPVVPLSSPMLASTLTPLFNATFSDSAGAFTRAATATLLNDTPSSSKKLYFDI